MSSKYAILAFPGPIVSTPCRISQVRIQSQLVKTLLIFIFSFLIISQAHAACHTVTPSGSGSKSGADWNNSYAGLPGTLVRGDIYYLADGTYSEYNFNTAASGTTTVEIRKAQSYDNCTSTGWNSSSMGSSQAVFSRSTTPQFAISAPYLILNGNGQQGGPGCGGAPGASWTTEPSNPKDCGIRIDNTGCTSTVTDACDAPLRISATNPTFDYVEVVGNCSAATGAACNSSDTGEITVTGGSPTNEDVTVSHMYGRNAGCVYFVFGADGRTVSNSYFWGTYVNGQNNDACHAQYSLSAGNDSNGTEFNNVYRDIGGTAIWSFVQEGTTNTHTNWTFYNNVIWFSSPIVQPIGLGNGVVACVNATVICTNFSFMQNSMINLLNVTGSDFCDTASGCSMTIENNIWYEAKGVDNTTPTTPGFGGHATFTQDHNSFLSSGSGCPTGTNNICDASSPNPFVSWTTGNFNLASENPDWTNRLALGSPYTTGLNGTTRTTDRGAYQISSLPAPINLTATVQ